MAFTKFLLRWWAPWKLWWTLFKSSFPTLDTLCRLDLQCFQTFRNCCLFCVFWLIRNIYSGDAHDANYYKRSLNHHFQYWTHSVYQIYSVFKLFETAVFSAPLGFYEISTVVMRIMLNMAKHSFNHHFQHCAHSVYQIYSVLKLFKIAVCFAHFCCYESSTLVMRIMLTMANIV